MRSNVFRTTKPEEVIANSKRLIEAFHRSDKPVIYSVPVGILYENMSKYQKMFYLERSSRFGTSKDPQSINAAIEKYDREPVTAELRPSKQDIVIARPTSSFFVGTMLDLILRARGVDTLVIIGVSTSSGVETTARHASCIGYFPVIAEDAVGDYAEVNQEASLLNLRKLFVVQKTDEIIKGLTECL